MSHDEYDHALQVIINSLSSRAQSCLKISLNSLALTLIVSGGGSGGGGLIFLCC